MKVPAEAVRGVLSRRPVHLAPCVPSETIVSKNSGATFSSFEPRCTCASMSNFPSEPRAARPALMAVATGARGGYRREDTVASHLELAEPRNSPHAPSSPPDLLWIAPPPLLQRAPGADMAVQDPPTTVPAMPRLIPAHGDGGYFLGQQQQQESISSLGSYTAQPPPYSLYPQSFQYPFFQPQYAWPQPFMLPGGTFSMPSITFPAELQQPPAEQHDATHQTATASSKTTRSPAAILHQPSK